jgi:hypothetical protein
MYGEPTNFCKELLTFEVVAFPSTYHALLEQLLREIHACPALHLPKTQDGWLKALVCFWLIDETY